MNVLRRSLMAAGLAAGLLTSVVSFAAKPKEIVFGIIELGELFICHFEFFKCINKLSGSVLHLVLEC